MAGRQEGEKEAPAGFADLPQEILLMVCSKLPSGDLLFNFPSMNRAAASAADTVCKKRAAAAKLRVPRHPRGQALRCTLYPHLQLLRGRACCKCGEAGEFHMRPSATRQRPLGLLCHRCTQDAGVRKVLVRKCLCLDMTGITGKKLLPSKRKGKVAP